jgi:hypothetical protein
MLSLWGIIIVVALPLAVIVTALFIGVCLSIATISDLFSGGPRHGAHGGGAQAPVAHSAGSRRRDGSRVSAGSRWPDR